MRIHRHLFDGVFTDDWVGRWRRVNLIKKEPVLRGDSVPYAPFLLIGEMLDYEFDQEKRRQAGLPRTDRRGIAVSAFDFMSRLWQIHPFREGNTRTVAVFVILYLRRLGFTVGSEPFASHARYLRDARLLCVVSWKGRFSIHPLNWRICSNPPVWILIGSGNPKAQEEIYRFDWFFAD